MNNSPMQSHGSFLDMMNVGSGDVNWGYTQNFSPIGEQATMSTENVVASA